MKPCLYVFKLRYTCFNEHNRILDFAVTAILMFDFSPRFSGSLGGMALHAQCRAHVVWFRNEHHEEGAYDKYTQHSTDKRDLFLHNRNINDEQM